MFDICHYLPTSCLRYTSLGLDNLSKLFNSASYNKFAANWEVPVLLISKVIFDYNFSTMPYLIWGSTALITIGYLRKQSSEKKLAVLKQKHVDSVEGGEQQPESLMKLKYEITCYDIMIEWCKSLVFLGNLYSILPFINGYGSVIQATVKSFSFGFWGSASVFMAMSVAGAFYQKTNDNKVTHWATSTMGGQLAKNYVSVSLPIVNNLWQKLFGSINAYGSYNIASPFQYLTSMIAAMIGGYGNFLVTNLLLRWSDYRFAFNYNLLQEEESFINHDGSVRQRPRVEAIRLGSMILVEMMIGVVDNMYFASIIWLLKTQNATADMMFLTTILASAAKRTLEYFVRKNLPTQLELHCDAVITEELEKVAALPQKGSEEGISPPLPSLQELSPTRALGRSLIRTLSGSQLAQSSPSGSDRTHVLRPPSARPSSTFSERVTTPTSSPSTQVSEAVGAGSILRNSPSLPKLSLTPPSATRLIGRSVLGLSALNVLGMPNPISRSNSAEAARARLAARLGCNTPPRSIINPDAPATISRIEPLRVATATHDGFSVVTPPILFFPLETMPSTSGPDLVARGSSEELGRLTPDVNPKEGDDAHPLVGASLNLMPHVATPPGVHAPPTLDEDSEEEEILSPISPRPSAFQTCLSAAPIVGLMGSSRRLNHPPEIRVAEVIQRGAAVVGEIRKGGSLPPP